MTDVTRILNAIEQRDARADDKLLPLLIVHAGIAQVREGLVATDAERQVDQDWSQGGQAFAVCGVSDGRGRCTKAPLSGNPCSHRSIESQLL